MLSTSSCGSVTSCVRLELDLEKPFRSPLIVRFGYRAGQELGRRVIFPPIFRVRVEGLNRVPEDGSAIVASNHFSNFDPILLGAFLPRRITYLAKRELVDTPVIGALYRLWGVVPVNRDGMDLGAIRQLLRVLRSGYLVGMYPEGTRSRDRVLHSPRSGAAYVALKAGVPILPVSIWGPESFSWRGWVRDGRTTVTIRFGDPIELGRHTRRIRSQDLDAAGEVIMRAIASGLPDRYRGVYA